MIKILLSLFFISASFNLWAFGERRLISSPRGNLMGDAYTAMADDEFTLFYNPASLARHKGFSFYPLNPQLSVMNVLSSMERFENLSNDPNEIYDAIASEPIHMGLSYAPGFKLGKFGLSVIVNNETDVLLLNRVSPKLYVNERYDKGFIMGYGLPLSGSFNPKTGGEQFSMGVSVKYLKREGLNDSFALTSPTILDAVDSGEINDILESLGRAKGQGWGVDIGFEWIKKRGGTTLSAGLSFLDPITNIVSESNAQGTEVSQEIFKTNFGLGFKQELGGGLQYTISADLHEINNMELDFRRKFKLGFSVGGRALRAMAGFNGGYYSYGVSADLYIINLFAGFYDVEAGEDYQQVRSNRMLIYLSLFDFTFDA